MRLNLKRHAPFVLALALYALDPTAFGLSRSVSASPQTFVTPKGEAQNVRFEQREGGTVHILYDLVASDPRAVFSVMLDASTDSGTTWGLRPQSVTGDTGNGVTAGLGKRIVWDSGKDVERVQIDRIRFRIVATAGPLKLETPPAPAAPRAGALAIMTTPAGAQVSIDGMPRGITPLTLADLAPGKHRVTVAKADYLDNSQTVEIVAGKEARIDVSLTVAAAAPPAGAATSPQPKGGKTKWIAILGGVGAAGAVAAMAGGTPSGSENPATGSGFPMGPTSLTATISAAPSGQVVSDHFIGLAPRNGNLNASLGWQASAAIILRYIIVLDGIDSTFAPLSCAFLNAPDCASSSTILLSTSVRQGARVVVRVINFSPVPVTYTVGVGFF